jgi:YVTN family beta-propeller protein
MIVKIDTSTNKTVGEIALPGIVHEATLTLDGKYLYTTLRKTNKIAVVSMADEKIVKMIPQKGYPDLVTMEPTGRYALVTNRYADLVSVIDLSTHAQVRTIPVGKAPHGMASPAPLGEAAAGRGRPGRAGALAGRRAGPRRPREVGPGPAGHPGRGPAADRALVQRAARAGVLEGVRDERGGRAGRSPRRRGLGRKIPAASPSPCRR